MVNEPQETNQQPTTSPEQDVQVVKRHPVVQHMLGMLAEIWSMFKLYTRLIIYIPLILLVIIALVLGTNLGSKIAIDVASELMPDLTLKYQSGKINDRFSLDYASWEMPGIKVEVDNLTVDWNPTCLLNQQICVSELLASSVTVNIVTDQNTEDVESALEMLDAITTSTSDDTTNELSDGQPDTAYEELTLPVIISLKNTILEQVKVSVNDMQFNAKRLSAKAIWNEKGLKVNRLESLGLFVNIPLSDDAETEPSVSEVEEWAMANLPEVMMPFPVYVKQFTALENELVLGKRHDLFAQILLSGQYKQTQISLSQFDFTHTYGEVALAGEMGLTKDYPLAVKLTAKLNNLAELPELSNQQLSVEVNNGFSNLDVKAKAIGDFDFNLDGHIDLSKENMPYKISIDNADISWPLTAPEYHAIIDNLKSEGDINQQHVTVKSMVTTPYHPQTQVTAEFIHQPSKIDITMLDAQSPAGNVLVNGTVKLEDEIEWDLAVILQEVRLQHVAYLNQQTPLKSRFGGQFTSQGKVSENNWFASISQSNLNGRFNGFPLSIQGGVSIDNNLAINSQGLQASALGANLSITGHADKTWDIDAELEVPDVSHWLKGARGNIYAKMGVTGSKEKPKLDINAQFNQFSHQGAKLDNLTINARYSPLEAHKYTLAINSQKLFWNNYKLSTLSLSSEGDNAQQQTSINSVGDIQFSSLINSQSDTNKQLFEVQVANLSLVSKLGKWQQNKPITLAWDNINRKGQLQPFCLEHPHSKFCVANPVMLGKNGQADLYLLSNPGQLFRPVLPKKLNWDGLAALTAQVSWADKRRPTGDINFTLLPGNITLNRSKENTINLDYQQLIAKAALTEQTLTANLNIQSNGVADLDGQVSINVTPDRTLSGLININELNLTPFGEFFPKIATLDGTLVSKLLLNGSIMEPIVTGNVKLNEGAFALTSNPTLIEQLYLNVDLAGNQGELNGQWHMGKGSSTAQGTLSWPDGQFSGDIKVKGKSLAVIQPPMAILSVSPDLHIQFDKKQLSVKGNVNIPSGQIKIVPLAEGGIEISEDVVFNDSIAEIKEKVSPYAIVADMNINVGKGLKIDGMGLKGKLSGVLVLQQHAFKPPLLFGDIKINEGSYKFMGQTLTINTGEVQFIGPAQQPNLNIEAVRVIKEEDITAGVRVIGTPTKPSVTLFSNPAKEQAEVLSYILTGKGFTNTSDQQSNSLMMGAALSLGSQIDGGAMSNIGNTATGIIEQFGFSNVQLDTNDEGKVAVSGFIGDSLMVKYGVGVFNPGYEMTVRYYILSQLYLESVSGSLNQSLDLYYSFEVE